MKVNEKQKEAIKLMFKSDIPVLWAGSIRSGKTVGGCIGLALHAQSREGRYILAGKSYQALMRNVVPIIGNVCESYKIPFKLKRSDQLCEIHKSAVHIFGANNEASQDYVQGMTADGFFLDELPLLPQSFFMQTLGRCSTENPFMLCTMNKTSPNHWTKVELVDTGSVALVESTLDDNPAIQTQTKELYDKVLTGHYHARMISNEWAGAAGRIWSDIEKYRGVVPSSTTLYAGVDAAQSGTTAAIFIGYDGERWVIVDEYVHTGERSFEEHANLIAQWNPAFAYVDPSAPGLMVALRKAGVRCAGANNKVEKGLQTVETAIVKGKLQYERCPNLLKEIAGYIWDEKAAMIGEDKPLKIRDHSCDALRYVVMGKIPMVRLAPITKPKGL